MRVLEILQSRTMNRRLAVLLLMLACAPPSRAQLPPSAEFIYDRDPPTKSCHASTIAQMTDGRLVTAWFGGDEEGNKDVAIWLARREEGRWTKPVEVADGQQPDGTRFPCWNPVLFQAPGDGPLVLFFKVGPRPSQWRGMRMTSDDGGRTWTHPTPLPDDILGPVKDKPVLLKDGNLLCPSSTEDHGWQIHMEFTKDLGRTWQRTGALNDAKVWSAIQPTILDHGADAGLQLLCRTRQRVIAESWSRDGGRTWSPLVATRLANPNSGIDAVQLRDGRSLLVYNPTTDQRTPLAIALSADGHAWKAGPVLESEPGEYSYPALIQTSDGLVHVTYTWKRLRIRHVVLDPQKLDLKDLPDAGR
jgi:predicted neuraminidase